LCGEHSLLDVSRRCEVGDQGGGVVGVGGEALGVVFVRR
jgi:hypothetical protein